MTVANSRPERDKTIGRLAGLSRNALLRELVDWTVAASEIADESRDLRRRRGEGRAMLELIAGELRSRGAGLHEIPAEAAAS